ncbi:hypothetical protein [Fundidesulfovibrio soli]|uniref:hypothetical protein n=1 Tax=Fundidesulfovibrio soli TaxID=2922716 RepID=UPI001FAEB0D7|nr:hypothetical protein [Fundidesulfovibrio soli]
MSLISDQDYCLFHRFWAFEYGKRNTDFLDAIKHVFRTSDNEVKQAHKKKLTSWGFNGWIDYYCHNFEEKIDMLGVIEGTSKIQYPDNPLFLDNNVTILSYNGKDEDLRIPKGHKLKKGQCLAKIDFSVSLKALIQSIAEQYEKYHGSEEVVEHQQMNFSDPGDIFALERRRISSMEDVSFEIDNIPRAVGIWIWDYVESKWGVHPPAKNTGFLAEAIETIKSVSPGVNKRYGVSGHQTFSKLYNRTALCINSVRVLTLK